MLKGKAKKDFEEWYVSKHYTAFMFMVEINEENNAHADLIRLEFSDMPLVFQQGVLLEFFREQGIVITLDRMKYEKENGVKFYYEIYDESTNIKHSPYISLDYNTAFTHAIDKACELYGRGE